MSLLYETVLGKLGGGLTLHFKPKHKKVFISPFGILCEEAFDFVLGVKTDSGKAFLPLADKNEIFEHIEQEISLTSLKYKAKSTKLGVIFEVKFISPFYPEDTEVSISPFLYIDIAIEKIPYKYDDNKSICGNLIIDLENIKKTGMISKIRDKIYIKDMFYAKFKVNKNTGLMDLIEDKSKKINAEILLKNMDNFDINNIKFKIDKDHKFKTMFIFAVYCKDVIVVKDKKENFSLFYTNFFKNIDEVINYGIINEKHIMEKVDAFEYIINITSLSKTQKDFLAYTFHSYLINTCWLFNYETLKDIFTVIEGNCGYHSTVDVEYNVALFYLLFWPELLKKELELWYEYVKENWMLHDIGALFEIGTQIYPHNMEVEENCNLILLSYAYWKHTADSSLITKKYDLLKKLANFIVKCDKNKDGIPDEKTANTIDDASAAVQFSKEQIYLGLKTYSALKALSEIANFLKDNTFVKFIKKITKKIKSTIEKKAWLKDHYVVCLDKIAKNLIDVWSGKKINGILEGWDAYSIYTSNGLLYLLISNAEIDLNKEKIKLDILNSKKYNMTEYGCTHTSKDKSNIWISQNLWHDFVGMYFGLDFSDNIERYWQFELFENTQGRGGCFVDTYGWNHLHYYPRGVTSFGLYYGILGLKVDRIKKEIKLSPVKVPLKVPLVCFANWKEKKFPVVECYIRNKKLVIKFYNKELLDGYKIFIEG
ncbi:MAG: DUF4965 domain-containing protein [Endomicrobiia bacterium]